MSLGDNRADYADDAVPAYARLEISFQVVGSVATDPFLPFAATPPPGVESGTGITVDGEVSADGFETAHRIPAFQYQDFQYEVRGGRDWLYPTTKWVWKVRFAPPTPGAWQYRIRATDAGGTTVSEAVTFTVVASDRRGFVRVSPTDPRYFEYEDGRYFPALGFNMNFDHVSWNEPVQKNRPLFRALGSHGVQVIRHWLSQWGVYGSGQIVWTTPERGADYAALVTADPANQPGFTPFPGSDVAVWLQVGWNHALLLGGWLKASPAVKAATSYRVRVRYQIPTALAGPMTPDRPYGLVAKRGSAWLSRPQEAGTGVPVTGYVSAATSGWQTLEGTFVTGPSQAFLDPFYLALENATTDGGTRVYIDRVDIEEDLGGGRYGPNIVSRPWMAHHQYVDQAFARAFDLMLQEAEASGVTLKLVLLEKNDFIPNHIAPEGTTVPRGSGSNANFYGRSHAMTRVRWLQQAWWRYAQARWGYSTAIHSWELLNEGDPFNGDHAALADEFGLFMRQFEPNRHLATTSTWHSMPHPFWQAAASLDYVDVHQYLEEGRPIDTRVDTRGMSAVATALPADFYDTVDWTERISLQLGALRPFGLGRPTMRGESGLATAGSTNVPAPLLARDTGGVWLHKWLWAQLNAGGLVDSGWWYDRASIYDPSDDDPNLLPVFKRYFDFVKDIPLSNGRYVDSDATVSNDELRVRGQKDAVLGRAHLWIDNRNHTWKSVVDGAVVTPRPAAVAIPGLPPGVYRLAWHDTYRGIDELTQERVTDAAGVLTFDLPRPVDTDVAVKIEWFDAAGTGSPG